ncbi:MAG: hypothetical protein Q9181_002830 [Wetmoreana brouardii]
MSVGFGFSVGDIIASYKLANAICENCFTRAQAADVKYLRFRQEINSLGESLRRLETILKNADAHAQRPRRPWHSDAEHFGEALRVLPEVTGDFQKTLKDCERLLQDHARLEYGRASVNDNLSWWRSTQRDVNQLRSRVNFHITKVSFIAKPFELQLLCEIRRELQLLRSDVAQIRGILTNGHTHSNDASNASYLESIHISDDLATRFTAALKTNRPPTFQNNGDWPVKEGFNALVFHFAKSTVEFTSNQRLGQNVPDPPQFLNLLKSVWAMRQLRASSSFQSTGSESLWANYMRELEADIKGQFHRFDTQQLVRPSSDDLLQLPDDYFAIWVDEDPPLRSLDIVEQRPLEEKILEIGLPESYGTRQSSLTVFRKSEYEFRLVRTTKMTDNPLYHSEEGSNVNMNSTRLIPAYASPENVSSPVNNLALCNDRGQHEEWHLLKNPDDVAALQRALLGYRIHHDMSDFSWCINGSKEPGDSGTGRLQMWQLKPLPKIELGSGPIPPDFAKVSTTATTGLSQIPQQSLDRALSASTSATYTEMQLAQRDGVRSDWRRSSGLSSAATRPRADSSDVRSLGTSHTTLVSGSSITATVNGPCGDGIRLLRPEVPVLVIFTMCQGRYTFLHMKLERNIFVNPESCACRNPKKGCRRVVLESKSKKEPFVVHRLFTNPAAERHLFSWDLAMFRYPHRPEFQGIKVVEKMMHLNLEFSSLEAKKEFLAELDQLLNVRNLDHNSYEKFLIEKRKRAKS